MLFEAAPFRFDTDPYLGQYGVQSWQIKPPITQKIARIGGGDRSRGVTVNVRFPPIPDISGLCPFSTHNGH